MAPIHHRVAPRIEYRVNTLSVLIIPDPARRQLRSELRSSEKGVPAQGIAPVVNPYDPQATEAALRLNDADGGGKVTVISLGAESSRDAIKHALAMGADEGVLITGAEFDGIDNFQTAKALAAAIKKLGDTDLILMGRAAADWDMGVVRRVSVRSEHPVVTLAKAIGSRRLDQGRARPR